MILIVVRVGVSNLDSSVVVYELKLAINRDLYGCLCSLCTLCVLKADLILNHHIFRTQLAYLKSYYCSQFLFFNPSKSQTFAKMTLQSRVNGKRRERQNEKKNDKIKV